METEMAELSLAVPTGGPRPGHGSPQRFFPEGRAFRSDYIEADMDPDTLQRMEARSHVDSSQLKRHRNCWNCLLRCFCLGPGREAQIEAAQMRWDGVVGHLALLSAEYASESPSLGTWATGLAAMGVQASEKEDADFDRLAPPASEWQATHNLVNLGVQLPATQGGDALPEELLLDVSRIAAHFARLSLAAYSTRLYGLVEPCRACATLACCLTSDQQAFSRMSGCRREDILAAGTTAEPFKPVWWLCRDAVSSAIVVAIRGTFSMSDVISDVLARQVTEGTYVVHEGVLISSRWLLGKVLPLLRNLPDVADGRTRVVVTGHSLGGAVAAVLAWLLRKEGFIPGVQAFVFGAPQIVDAALAREMERYVFGIVHDKDMVPRISRKSVEDLRHEVAKAAEEPAQRLARLEAVLAEFRLPRDPESLRKRLLTGVAAEVPCIPATSSCASSYKDAFEDVSEMPALPMRNPGWQLLLQRRALASRSQELKPILRRSTMRHFLITAQTPVEASLEMVRPAVTMWSDHFPQAYMYVCEELAERLEACRGNGHGSADGLRGALERLSAKFDGNGESSPQHT
eukprot:TRINITY_DN107489_c0_g1_i1.p1 TRINITY_DN107489_c0_g1~~TRINITY_DN107489_c0_g1_i1.p1  ORF type:complete len:573 (+),score=103.28 TRINITY_DN107489_c0_g1_i1:46-1764(+)